MFCTQCGTAVRVSARFCHACGTPLPVGVLHGQGPASEPVPPSDQTRSALSQDPASKYRGGAATHVLKWVVRLAAGAVSIVLAILGNATSWRSRNPLTHRSG